MAFRHLWLPIGAIEKGKDVPDVWTGGCPEIGTQDCPGCEDTVYYDQPMVRATDNYSRSLGHIKVWEDLVWNERRRGRRSDAHLAPKPSRSGKCMILSRESMLAAPCNAVAAGERYRSRHGGQRLWSCVQQGGVFTKHRAGHGRKRLNVVLAAHNLLSPANASVVPRRDGVGRPVAVRPLQLHQGCLVLFRLQR